MTLPPPPFAHLRRLTDAGGLYEHARWTRVRREHGYCVDDVARALVVVSREVDPPPVLHGLAEQYLDFVLAAQVRDGRFRNRRGTDLRWWDGPSVEDCWGRALWGLGAAVSAAGGASPGARVALAAFERGAVWRSPHVRATAFAALGAAEVLAVHPDHAGALLLVADAARAVGGPLAPPGPHGWVWPEARLRYANAALPEVLLLAGAALGAPALVDDGLALLAWLLDEQTHSGHLSVVPVAGRGPGERPPGFDQQPIEVAALADACARAHEVTGDPRWLHGLELAAAWFLGANDVDTPLWDPESGGGCDGLTRGGRNENQGAESTLALVSTLQQCRRLAVPVP